MFMEKLNQCVNLDVKFIWGTIQREIQLDKIINSKESNQVGKAL